MEAQFKERFAQFFNHVGDSQSGFADRAGIQQVTVSQLLAGRSKPSLKTANKLRDAFPNLNLDWLLEGRGEMLHDSSSPAVLRRLPSDPAPPTPIAGPLAVVPESAEVKELKEQNKALREQIKFLQDLMRSGADFSKLAQMSFSLGDHDADEQRPHMAIAA